MKTRGKTYDWNGHTDMPIDYADMCDEDLAGKVRMLMRGDLEHEAVVCAARDRIMALVKAHDANAALIEQLTGALRFIIAFYEPGQTHLDTNAWKQAEAGGRRALAAGEAYLRGSIT
jgi:hypothetical protein